MRGARRRVAVRCPPCAARFAPRWLGLGRARAGGGGGGGEAGGCGRECGRARGTRGRGALRAPPAPPPVGPASEPRAALFLGSTRAPPRLARAPGPGRFVFPGCPPLVSTPGPLFRRRGRFVRPLAPRIPSLSPPRSCPPSGAPLLFPSLFGPSVTCHRPGTRFLSFFFFPF